MFTFILFKYTITHVVVEIYSRIHKNSGFVISEIYKKQMINK